MRLVEIELFIKGEVFEVYFGQVTKEILAHLIELLLVFGVALLQKETVKIERKVRQLVARTNNLSGFNHF